LTPVPEPQVDELTPAGMSFASLVRGSLFHLLNERLRAPPNAVSARVLKSIRDALQDDRIDVALRHVDRAWRQLPEHSATFAPIYGRLLSLEATDFNAALGLLRCAVDFAPDPDAAALTVHALLRLQRAQEARREFNLALADYCVEPGGLLARAGGEILKHAGLDAPGWIGRGPNLEVVGELAANEPNVLEISIDGGTRFTQILPHLRPEGGRLFTFDPPQPGMRIRLGVRSRGTELLGSNADARDDFLLDGRTESRGRRLTGWARIGWSPAKPVALRLEDETGRSAEIRTRDVADPSWRWPFAVDLNAAKLSGNRIHVSAQLPDGRWQPLPDSPLLLEPALRAGHKPLPLTRWKAKATGSRLASHVVKRAKTIDVIIPVYGGRDETLSCIDAVLASIGDDARLVVVDDASDDPTLSTALDELEADGNIQLLRNVQNQGFVASVNRGLQLHPTHDAVVLNSDTLVFGDWLARLRAAAYSAPTVGTVTPLSNSGSIASYPRAAGSAIDPQSAAALHALAASTLPQTRVEIPVGVGFCLYIRRDCLRDVGELDAAMFGKGYGEETDFCLRARHRGWSHRLAADVFVYHAGGISFGGRRQALLDRSQRLLNLRHPGYDRFIASFLARDPLHPARRRLDERRLLAFEGRFVLLVTLALAGGVDRYVTERSRVLKAQGLVPLVLRPAAVGTADRSELWTDVLELPNLQFDVPQELPALVALLGALCIDAVEIQHFLHLDARLIEAVRALSIPYDVVIHDYSWICPRVTLIDGTNRYCGEPEVSVCQACVRRNGSKLGEKISVPALRARSATWLKGARQVTAPSADTAARMQRYFDALTVEVRPHAEKIVPAPLPVRTARRTTLRVALIGAIGTHKGYRILLDCARDARARRLPIEFVVIGHTENDAPLLATGKVFVTGQYSEAEAPHLIQREQPDMAWLPSVWPETWCYTLDHALNAGLPVAAFDVGAIAERLQTMGAADLMPLELDAPRINDRLLEFGGRQHQRDFTIVDSEQRLVQPLVKTPVPHSGDDATMSDNTADEMFMTKASNGTSAAQPLKSAAQPVKDEGLSASVQVLPLPKGLYLFSVKAAGPPPASNGGPLSLPAMHVGLGPGVRPDQVEFIAGPSTYGAWLFSAGDLLVTKVNGSGATLILTSVRAPGGETLSIKVERLEDRGEGIAAAAPAAPVKAPALPTRTNGAAAAKKEKGKPVFDSTGSPLPLPVQIGTHIRTRGDMNFANVPWAGRVAPGLWIESFAVLPLEHFGPQDIEYKGLTGSGFETPWMSDNQMCGTKGMATPLVGFAIRLKPSPAAAAFDCEYSGYFQSGITVGPLRNGAWSGCGCFRRRLPQPSLPDSVRLRTSPRANL
jgi:GT2 family glycosyltransferase